MIATQSFHDQPILNSPYAYPGRHWELDASGHPTDRIIESRRVAAFVTPIPKPRKRRTGQSDLLFDDIGLSTQQQVYADVALLNGLRAEVDKWRALKNPADWGVSPITERLLQHWREHDFSGPRPFFCQIEAAETVIWLTEVAPRRGAAVRRFLDHLKAASDAANPGLWRLALKLATGAGKTTVMAMLIAWQTLNAIRLGDSKRFTHGFLLVAPGLTIKERLRVLLPSDPDNYYKTRELVPDDLLADLGKALIVITNYHAFKRRERLELAKGGRLLLQGPGRRLQVKVNGVEVFHPATSEVRSDGPDGIACWFIDTDYNEESFFVRHAYFLGANDPYKALKTTLKAEIDADAWATLNRDISRPFERPASGRIAVTIINHLGDEVMKVFRVN